MSKFEFKRGDRVVVEVPGTVIGLRDEDWGLSYIIRPHNAKIQQMRVAPEAVFSDDGAEVISNVIRMPRPVVEAA